MHIANELGKNFKEYLLKYPIATNVFKLSDAGK